MAVTVHVWDPWDARDRSGRIVDSGIGHASLHINGKYLSFWPKEAIFSIEGCKYTESVFSNYQHDQKEERRAPDKSITLMKLDENRVGKFVNSFFAKKPKYHPAFNNCTHPIKIALYEGTGCQIGPNFKVDVDPSYGLVQQLPWWLQGTRVEKWVKETWNPIDVARYAEMLKRKIG